MWVWSEAKACILRKNCKTEITFLFSLYWYSTLCCFLSQSHSMCRNLPLVRPLSLQGWGHGAGVKPVRPVAHVVSCCKWVIKTIEHCSLIRERFAWTVISAQSMIPASRCLKPVPDKPNDSVNVVNSLCPIFLEFIRRGLFCWLHYALLPHSKPFNRILPGIEFSFERRGSKPHLSFFFPTDLCSLQNKRKTQARAGWSCCGGISKDRVQV